MSNQSKDDKRDKREFKTAKDVDNVIKPMEDIERVRAGDRAKIDDLFNGKRPYSKEEEEKYQIQINVNWQEGKRIMRDANAQVNSALLHPGTLFTCSLEKGKTDMRDEWGQTFTQNLHMPLQRRKTGRRHYFVIKARNASICMHGVGILLWTNPSKWLSRFVPMEDFLVPTETYCDFTNLRYFAVNQYLTPGELVEMTQGDKVAKGWNDKMVKQILDNQRKVYNEGVPSTWRDQPEAMRQIHNENKGYYYSDAVPKIRCRWFFYQEVDEPNKWYRCMVLREAYGDAKPGDDFLFDGSDTSFANDISEIISVQYGDNNLVAPLKYHTVRGLGIDLYAPVETQNRLRCQFVQSVFEHLLMYFRVNDPSDRDRLKQIVLSQFGILPEGLQIVPRGERHEINPQLVDEAMGQMKQIMQESSSSFLQNVNDDSSKTMTAQEANIKMNQANVMVSSMLQSLYLQETFYYEELVRRFCKKGSEDKVVQAFQKDCKDAGIPEELIYDNTAWCVTPERVLGGGDQSKAQQEAGWLWSQAALFDPAVQPKLRRTCVSTILQDPNKARDLVPLAKVEASEGVMAAENVFGTLMQGQPVAMRKGIDQQGYIETLIKMVGGVIQRITSTDNVGTMYEITGMMTAIGDIQQHIGIMDAGKNQGQLVKQYSDAVGQMTNLIKAFGQRLMEKQKADATAQQGDPAAAAKAQATMMGAQVKAQVAQQNLQLKTMLKQKEMQLKQALSALEEQRKNAQVVAQIQRDDTVAAHKMGMERKTAHQQMGQAKAEHIQSQIQKAEGAAVDAAVKIKKAKNTQKSD